MTRVRMNIECGHEWFMAGTAIGAILRIIDRAVRSANAEVTAHNGLYHTETPGGRARLERAKREAAAVVTSLCSEWTILVADLIEFGHDIIWADGANGCGQSYMNKFHPAADHTAEGWQYGIHIREFRVYSPSTGNRLATQAAECVARRIGGEAAGNFATPASAQQIEFAAKWGATQYLAAIKTIQPRDGEAWRYYCRTLAAYHVHLIRNHIQTASYFVPDAATMQPTAEDYAMVDAAFAHVADVAPTFQVHNGE